MDQMEERENWRMGETGRRVADTPIHPFKILVFAGPSGGHLFPALAFAEAIRERFPKSRLHLVTSKKASGLVLRMRPGVFDETYYLPDFPFPSGISLNVLRFLLEFPRAFIFSSRYLSRTRPDLCVGFGSYAAYPGMLMAAWRDIPTLIHEQNFIPGRTTQWLARHVDCVTVTFEGTFAAENLKRCEFVGLPLRKALREVQKPQDHDDLFRLLIVGGSQGSHRLNEVVLETFFHLTPEEKKKIAVIHIAGQTDYGWVADTYRRIGISFEAHPFFENIQELYLRSDLAITRAGANTLFELALFKLPAIVIPYPYAGAHQRANAEYFARRGAIITQQEERLTKDWLLGELQSLSKDSSRRQSLSKGMASLARPEAAEKLVDIAEEFLNPSVSGMAASTPNAEEQISKTHE